ncbi:MAG: magnesium-translocating P-type ATPase [Candidatus Fimivicinus sp.]|nr:magnesium-translocating P-type ATPase [Oscillospiraceae bacterium]MDY5591255.1 magnesium-translocating P-type ATPase [Candidatus Fimivicinus sp.]
MKKIMKNRILKSRIAAGVVHRDQVNERLRYAAVNEIDQVYAYFDTSAHGLTQERVENARETFGSNIVTHGKKEPLIKRLFNAFVNPFTAILFVLAIVSAFTDIIWAQAGEKDPTTVIIIATMVMISGVLRFVQETRSGNAAAKLSAMIRTTASVERAESGCTEIPMDEIVVGDVVHLSAGDMVPADIRITFAKDLFVSQSALTGESEPVEKLAQVQITGDSSTQAANLVFMGSNVISGSAIGVVLATGNDTLLGDMAKQLSAKPPKTSFEKGVNAVSWVLIRFMLIMVPVVLFVNGFTKGDWMNALLFAISVAVGLTPEMLPMIVTTCLAKGAVSMSKKKVIIKNLNAIQNLGSIDILCTDKTGTLTQDKVVLEYHLDIHGNEDDRVLRHAFLNSYYQTGLKNLMDIAIIKHASELAEANPDFAGLESNYTKVDEIPFNFERRRMSVVVADKSGKTQMITKGAIEEMLRISSHVEYGGEVTKLTEEMKKVVLHQVDALNADGMRVLGVAQKTNPSPAGEFSVKDESDMVLIGYLAFLDPPKETTAAAINALNNYGVGVKILTGDNEKVTKCICRQVGLSAEHILMGDDFDDMTDEELGKAAEKTTVFAKLSPSQKARVVRLLRENGHSVGYMGDGINDAAAMKASDVGISVDTAVDIAKESADVILLEKDLMVLEEGIVEGRKTYANMIKYIKMTASSNFGNMFSVLVASAFLPFLPMESIHLILLNLIYDISCTAIPWDHVDREYLLKPRKWDAFSVSKFMIWIGPTSSVFDIATYLLMYFIICPAMLGGAYHQLDASAQAAFIAIFQAGWFVESMWSQTLVIHMIRTPKIPFLQSRASAPVTLLTFTGIAVLTAIPFTPLGTAIGLSALPAVYFAWLAGIILCYMVLATVMKKLYIKKYGELL